MLSSLRAAALASAVFVPLLPLVACGGAPPPAIPPAVMIPAAPPDMTPAAPPPTTASSKSAPPPAPAPAPTAYVDNAESASAIRVAPLFGEKAPTSTFHAAKLGDAGCLKGVKLTGDHTRDYATVTGACGAPTGLSAYTKPMSGMLHATLDKTDSYVVALAPGYCYRVIGTSDQTIFDLGLSVHPASGGAPLTDGEKGPVAVAPKDAAFCVDQGGDWGIDVDVQSDSGTGSYTVGVFARPKKKEAEKK